MIEKNGLEILILDFGVMGEPAFAPDITRQEVVKAGGGDLATLASGAYKDEAMRVMAAGLAVVVRRLFDDGRLDGIIGMGGGTFATYRQEQGRTCGLAGVSDREWYLPGSGRHGGSRSEARF